MTINWFQKLILGVAGLAALGIGLAILTVPAGFYGTYGIELGADPNLLSELRAPGANLAVLGAIILLGAFRQSMTRLSAAIGGLVFLAYALGRIVSMALDGMPSSGLIEATVIELVIGGLCIATFWLGQSRKEETDPLLTLRA
jgi:hypothetical protein